MLIIGFFERKSKKILFFLAFVLHFSYLCGCIRKTNSILYIRYAAIYDRFWLCNSRTA